MGYVPFLKAKFQKIFTSGYRLQFMMQNVSLPFCPWLMTPYMLHLAVEINQFEIMLQCKSLHCKSFD